jgi:hypothetical protein
MKASARPEVAPADPSLWSEQSQRSVAAAWTKEYRDIPYRCWRCRADAVFTAQDQKHAFEVQKAPIDQRRVLCEDCWRQSVGIGRELGMCESRWSVEKPALRKDKEFLARWLQLLEAREEYVAYKPDTAKKNMLKKLLADA